MMLNHRLLLWIGFVVVGELAFYGRGIASTFNPSQGILQLNNFSHVPQEISTFESAFAHVTTEQKLVIIQSDPPFVTGADNIFFHPLVPIVPPTLSSYHLSSHAQGNLISAPFSFNGIDGLTSGENHIGYADPNYHQLSSVTLKSTSQLTVSEINHSLWTVGQSGFQGNFMLGSNETFSFTLNSSLPSGLDNANLNPSQQLRFKQSQVVYFWAKPTAFDFPNLILMFPLYPRLSIAVNNSRVEAGLLGIQETFTPQIKNSLQVSQNSTSPENFPYFQLNTNSAESVPYKWHFEYKTNQPMDLTVIAYTSNNLISIQTSDSSLEPVKQKPKSVPESLDTLPLFFVGFIIFFFIRR